MVELRVRFRENSRKEGLPGGTGGKQPICQRRFNPLVRKIPWRRAQQPTPGKKTQCSCLENPMDRGAWWTTVHSVAESDMTEATQ